MKANWRFFFPVALLLIAAAVFGVWHSTRGKNPQFDATMLEVLKRMDEVQTYTQYTKTETVLVDRHLRIEGTYHLDLARQRFSSVSTTTLTIPNMPRKKRDHAFTHEHISIGDDIYTKIQTESEVLKSSIPHSKEWRHFEKTSIPEEFETVAVSGSILDNLALLRSQGKYLIFLKKQDEKLSGRALARYTFTISPRAASAGGNIDAIAERIGNDGLIDVWIDEKEYAPVVIRFENPPYYSTTTISAINKPLLIEAPVPAFDATVGS